MSKIIVDSCCDMTTEMKNEMGIVCVPLTMTLGSKEFTDDDCLDIDGFMEETRDFAGKSASASPPPVLYQEAIEAASGAYVVTLSSKLSGSYNNAVIGNNQAIENGSGAAYVFDSKSVSAGETLVAIKIRELISAGLPKERLIETVKQFISNMQTFCTLENYDIVQKNGRLSKVAGSLIQVLNIRLIMGSDGDGEIVLHERCRGMKQVVQKLLSLIQSSGRTQQGENLVISHCKNHSAAEQLKTLIQERFSFKKVYIVPTGGVSSLYAADRGIVLAF